MGRMGRQGKDRRKREELFWGEATVVRQRWGRECSGQVATEGSDRVTCPVVTVSYRHHDVGGPFHLHEAGESTGDFLPYVHTLKENLRPDEGMEGTDGSEEPASGVRPCFFLY